jgi:hypothetical protein
MLRADGDQEQGAAGKQQRDQGMHDAKSQHEFFHFNIRTSDADIVGRYFHA